ncbi:TPA: NAD-dependent ubiquitin ligase, partial [Legionella pneumophila]|nr:NAD-dependent ubiquitin ligase [Legionella pneumophila]HDV5761902.1 NAD-dependent ubiquitin ligase [Legionella pneumophila]HDV5827531.1 NAD-dependent ubiquitin ligase [Legionella pneumophila]HDV5842476.1 NAD-dependent ubiquitin ligase [Legionella pneumophila]HDV5950431.1 NAD-dependent ubiquitin ligase [Legionella pneumophila]
MSFLSQIIHNHECRQNLGKTSGEGYKNTLLAQLPIASTLSVIPNNPGLNMGLCGYWVASVGLKAR